MKAIDLTGLRFGRLVARGFMGTEKGKRIWRCECDCGNSSDVAISNLRSGNTTSCGCYLKEQITTHGQSFHPLYKTWSEMRRRCNDETLKDYPSYGGRGISVCKEWEDFDSFSKDMGVRPDGMTLERIDNNGGYSPDNCKWATRKEQTFNRRVTLTLEFNGATKTMQQWSDDIGIPYRALHQRINSLGWSVEKALTTPYGRWPK